MNLDDIPVERKYLNVRDITTTLRRFAAYRDWDSLCRFVLQWGIGFRFRYPCNRNGIPISDWPDDVIIYSMKEHPYYEKVVVSKKELRKAFKKEGRCSPVS